MSVINDNKNFVSTVLGVVSPDFDKATFGIWVSFFQNVNYSDSGYTLPQPLVEDIVASQFTVTGKRFSIVTSDGKAPKARFFLTSGIKGINGYESLTPVAEITNTYVSGYKPEIIMPDMDFAGKIFRRTEVLSTTKSPVSKNNVLSFQAEDWAQTSISVNANNTEETFSYVDSNYTPYSNESITRYKFLYDDSDNSVESKFTVFDLPIQLEQGAVFKYRISRKSEPLGQSYFVDLTADGRGVIDYSKYKDEVSGFVDGKISYDFNNLANITLGKEEFLDGLDKINIVKPIQNDTNITAIKVSKAVDQDGVDIFNLSLLSQNQSFDDIYKVEVSYEKYKLNVKEGIVGYVMSSYNMGDGASTKNITLSQGKLVYPRVSENGSVYKNKEVSDLVDIQQILESESFAQNITQQQNAATQSESVVGKTMSDYFKALNEELQNEYGEDDVELTEDEKTINQQNALEAQDINNLIEANSSTLKNETALPNFQLPKKIISSDFYSNYLNSGEKYVGVPVSRYSNNFSYLAYGDTYGFLGYSLGKGSRVLYNSTCEGIYINQVSFCKGDTATQKFKPPEIPNVNYVNGAVTEIPSNGIIIKDNYERLLSWQNAVNYYYTKNYIQSFDVYPTYAEIEYKNLFTQALTKIKKVVGGPTSISITDNSFLSYGASEPRIYVEREIYTQEYETDQDALFNNCFSQDVSISDSEDLATAPKEKLYCVQNYDLSNFARNKQSFFYPIQNYDEMVTFSSFIPNSEIFSYTVDESNSFGTVLFTDPNPSPKNIFRVEYITGSDETFSYTNYSNAEAWHGLDGDTIHIINQDTRNFAYHLYTYSADSDVLTLAKSNVLDNEVADVSLTKAVVLKFTKRGFKSKYLKDKPLDANGNEIEYSAIILSVLDSAGNFYDPAKTKINIQTYNYEIVSPDNVHQWYIFNKNPINDNSYGLNANESDNNPRFFEDISEENKAIAEDLFAFPNGPCTSKNYEGSPIGIDSINGLADGLFSNNIKVKEQTSKSAVSYESNSSLDFEENGRIIKQKAPIQGTSSIVFGNVKRLKITRVKYNFYTKDLVLIGDAGFPNSAEYNYGWEYKLQYRVKNSGGSWKTLEEKGAFNTSEITTQSSQLSPYYKLLGEGNFLKSLQMIAFKTNMPLFLDDSNYEFRIAKYQKLHVFNSDVDVIKKVNFLPIKVQWTADPDCEYYNIYQKDSGNNLSLLATENQRNNLSYVVPDVKQSYIDLGAADFGSPNHSGYYDVVVSGITPTTKEQSNSLLSEYGFEVGNSNEQITINKISDQPIAASAKQISNPTYTPLINFNNPESKNSAFTINPNYNGYYFVTDSSSASLSALSDKNFEGYVANTGASSCTIGAQTLSSSHVAAISNNGAVSTSSLQSLPSATIDLNDLTDEQLLYLKSSTTITNTSSVSSRVLEIINDSNSSINVTYNSADYAIAANKTSRISFSLSAATVDLTRDNVSVQDDLIYYPATGFVNINHSDVTLDPAKTATAFPIYNLFESKLSVNDSIDLPANSFSFVNWDGTTASATQKDYFDFIKIFLIGNELADDRIILLKDDAQIILSNFASDSGQTEEYFFLKDELVTRNLSISIVNGSSKYILPIDKQDFKLTVYKVGSTINYKILYPSSSPFFEISTDLEQLVLFTEKDVQSIDLNYLESSIPKGAFIYIVNKAQSDIIFYKGDITQASYVVSPNQIARASIVTIAAANSVQIDIVNSAYSHFIFDIDPATHLTNAINILDLNFCGTSINLPSVSSLASKNTFLLCRNRTIPNKIDNQLVSSEAGLISTEDNPTTKEINEIGQLSADSISLSLYKKNVSDILPTLERTSFIKNGLLGSEKSPDSDITSFFFIKDDDLKSFSIRDFYNRKTLYSGKVFLPSPREMRINSFDDNHFYRTSSDSISFDYTPDKYVNGRLAAIDEDDSVIISRDTEKASVTKAFPNALAADQMLINFAYDAVTVSVSSVSKTIKKNRLIKNDSADLIYPVYNSKEFFIAATNVNREATGTTLYYEIIGAEMDVESIILPDSSAVVVYVIKNSSSRTYQIYTLAGLSIHSLAPNTQKEFIFNGSSYNVNNNSTAYDDAIQSLSIKTSNQQKEADSDHPLSSLWASGFSINAIAQSFIGSGSDTTIEIISSGTPYQYGLFDVLSSVPSSSDKIIYCYGRKSGILDIGDNKYLVNAFYLFLYYNDTIIKENEFYTTGDQFNTAQAYPLSIVEFKHIDLLKYLPDYQSVMSLPNVILIPITSQLNHYYLPNLNVTYNDGSSSFPTLGTLLSGKKIIFVNMVKASKDARNQITNYNGNLTEELIDLNSLVMYEISSGQWVKSTVGVPVVKPVYPTLDNVKGLSLTQTSEISDGSEFVYLPNFNRFNITIDSFKNKEFRDFYILNSASNRVFINSNQSMLSSNKFVKIHRDSLTNSFSSQELQTGGSSPFVLVNIQSSAFQTVDQMVESAYPNLKLGTYLKVIESVNSGAALKKYTHFYSYGDSGKPAKVTITNEFFVDLDLFNFKSYSSSDKLFIYGTSGISQEGASEDSYNLRLLNSETLDTEKFYVYNNSNNNLKIFFKKSDSDVSSDFIILQPRRMVEISDKACYMELHEKGKFYIGSRKNNKTYLNKIDLPLFVDGLQDYKSLIASIENITFTNDINSMALSLSYYKDQTYFYYYDDIQSLRTEISLDSDHYLDLKTIQDFYIKNLSRLIEVKKPGYKITSGGHYILNNSSYNIKIDSSVLSQNLFLVNNCAQNIQVYLTVSSTESKIILYRNTVLVINTSGETRYLKKAKRRDEFYCVFNPKTAISTQYEIAFTNRIPRTEDVQPINNRFGAAQQSYIKFLSRYGTSSITYLSIKDYYNGIDVPTDSPEGIVAYEGGLGHETICKFLFFNPSESTYTLPGIVEGERYRVDVDYGLFENISNLPGLGSTQIEEDPYVIYNGIKYKHNDIIEGSYVSFYELKYPNYIKLFKITQDIDQNNNLVPKENSEIDELIQTEVVEPINKNNIFYQIINESMNEYFKSSLCWIPKEEEAFWMNSDVTKNIWQIDSVDSGSTKQFVYDDRQVTFTKCTLKKTDLRSPIVSTNYVFYSALQDKSVANLNNNPPDEFILLGEQITEKEQIDIITKGLRAQDNLDNYIVPKKEIFLGTFERTSIFPPTEENSKLADTEFEIRISIDKLNSLPNITFTDFSKSQVIQILNDKI